MQPLELLVQPARRSEVRQSEDAARVLEAVAQHIQRPAPADLAGQPRQKARFEVPAVVLAESFPCLWLRGENEVDHVSRKQTERSVVVLRPAFPVAAGERIVSVRRCGLPDGGPAVLDRVGAVPEQGALDRVFEGAFGNVSSHQAPLAIDRRALTSSLSAPAVGNGYRGTQMRPGRGMRSRGYPRRRRRGYRNRISPRSTR